MSQISNAYVSVLQWAEGTVESDWVEALVASCAFEPRDAELKIRKGLPQVLVRAEVAQAGVMLGELRRRGVMAFAPSASQVAALGEAPRIKRLFKAQDGSGYVCEMWRGEGTAFRFDDVFCLVRAKLISNETKTSYQKGSHSVVRGYMMGGSLGAIGARVANSYEAGPKSTSRISTTDILDLYMRDGRRLRLDADKLNFDVLGDARGYSDHVNMGLLSDRIRESTPRAMYDEGFKRFVCPMEFTNDRAHAVGRATLRSRSDAGPYEFYSPWVYLMYEHLLGGG